MSIIEVSKPSHPLLRPKHQLYVAAILTFWLFPRLVTYLPELGTDPSWMFSINYGYAKGLIFGKDLIFTFGPLGFVFSRMHILIPLWKWLLADALVYSFVFYCLIDALRFINNLSQLVYITLAVVFAAMPADSVFLLFLVQLYAMKAYLENPKHDQFLIIALIVAVFNFYIKLNLGIVGLGFYFSLLGFKLIEALIVKASSSKAVVKPIIYMVLTASLIFAMSWLLKVDLVGYVGNALSIIDGYNDAMFVAPNSKTELLIAMAVYGGGMAIIAFSLLGSWEKRKINWSMLFMGGILFASFFVLAKQGLTRFDQLHFSILCGYSIPLVGLAVQPLQQKNLIRLGLAGYILATLGGLSISVSASGFELPLVTQLIKPNHHFVGATALPSEWLRLIGQSTVDVLPEETILTYFNNLNYKNRPVIQSYKPYNQKLETHNCNFYTSRSRPIFILQNIKSLDGRVPFWDDQWARLALLTHYSMVDWAWNTQDTNPINAVNGGDSLLLFKAKSEKDVTKFKEVKTNDFVGKMNTAILLPSDSSTLLILTAKPVFTTFGKIKRALFQPSALMATFTFNDGSNFKGRAVKGIIEGGVLVQPLITSDIEAKNFYSSAGYGNFKGKRPISITIEANADYQPIFSYTITTLKLK